MKSLEGLLARLLICNLLSPAPITAAAPARGAGGPAARPNYVSTQLQGDERILQALNRFTFGPRPGDLAGVRAMGLDAWFERQLHPATIDETDLNARLARFPAMRWSTRDLLFRMPANPIIRQAADRKIEIPPSGALHAVYENAMYRMQAKKAEKAEKTAAVAQNSAPGAAAQPPMMDASAAPANTTPPLDGQSMALEARMDAPVRPDEDSNAATILALPPQQRVAKLTAMQPAEFEAFTKSMRPVQRQALNADLPPDLREAIGDLENPERAVVGELMAERLTRDIYSNAQLQEVMTDFWLNHFNIYLRKNEVMPYYLVSYERDVIRPRALGRFGDLLEAVAHSPAMLVYLDNAESIGPDSMAAQRAESASFRRPNAKRPAPQGLNENYARELMELHTLGVNGGYTQADVIQVARVLTGWTVDRPFMGGDFTFNPNRHEPGAKKVMGKRFKDGGEKEGRALLHMLAAQPATAKFLSGKLATRFVSDDPPQALVNRMAKAYLASGGDIPTVLRTLFRSPEFWSASDYRAKVKTPLEFVVSAARASNADVENFEPLINAMRQMGMPLYGCIPPIGWDWKESTWVSTSALVDRMNFALTLAANRFPGVKVNWAEDATTARDSESADPESEEARLEPAIVPGGVSVSTRSAALEHFQAQIAQSRPAPDAARAMRANEAVSRPIQKTGGVTPQERQDQLLAGLLLGSPEFQRR